MSSAATGTTDIVDRCIEKGLREPEFHQDEDFRAVLWRPEVQEGGKERGKERGKEIVREGIQENININKIVMAIRGNTVSSREIMVSMRLKGGDSFRKRYLYPSIELGYVSMLYPNAPKRRDQAYYLTDKGLQLLSELLKK